MKFKFNLDYACLLNLNLWKLEYDYKFMLFFILFELNLSFSIIKLEKTIGVESSLSLGKTIWDWAHQPAKLHRFYIDLNQVHLYSYMSFKRMFYIPRKKKGGEKERSNDNLLKPKQRILQMAQNVARMS